MEEEVRDLEGAVIGDGLVQRALGQRHRLRLALDDHQRLHLPVIDNRITALLIGHGGLVIGEQ